MKKLFSLFILIFSSQILLAQQKEKILATDLTRIKQVSGIQISPDGKRAIYALNTIEATTEANEFEYKNHIYLIDLQAGAVPKALTRGSESARQAVWSPDGKSIAFVRNVKTKSQIFIMPLDGGEAWQLTNGKYGAGSPQFSPDGSKILFSSSVSMSELLKDSTLNPTKAVPSWSFEKPGFKDNSFIQKDPKIKANPDGTLAEIRAYLDKNVEDKKAKVFNRLNFQGEATTEPEMSFSQLFIIDVKEGAMANKLNSGFYSSNGARWNIDGKMILFTTQADSLLHPDRSLENRIVSIGIDGNGWKTLVKEKNFAHSQPTPSPDGKWLIFNNSQTNWLGFNQLMLAKADGSMKTKIDFDRASGNLTWTADSKFLYFTAASNGGTPLYRLDIVTKKVEQLSDFDIGINDFDLNGQRLVFSQTNISNPSELMMADLNVKNVIQLSNHNDWISKKALSSVEKRSFKNEKGQSVEYWIMKPTKFESGKKYPLLLNMHGGPTAMWGPGEGSMWHEFQYMAAQGYGIVYANPRGSGGYGKDFQFANYRDWGKGPASDVLRACSEAAKENWVDTSKQVITGGSYAGYLTAWIVAHDHRFKAAFAQRGVYDLTTFMGEGNAWRLVPNYFGLPWKADELKVIRDESPYSYVDKIKTPLLIKHGENDLRTGLIQSEMMYKSMKIMGKEVEYVRMPGATHELSRTGNPRQRIDRILRIYEFFERYVGGK